MAERGRTSRLLVISRGAGGMNPDIELTLREAFPDFRVATFSRRLDLLASVTTTGTVIVAGGDGTIGKVARTLAGTRRTLGILSLGTYNNFARALGLPEELEKAIDVVQTGRPQPVTLGRAGDRPFLEAAAAGVFGQAIVLGESAKERAFGELSEDLRAVAGARPFEFTISGDFEAQGKALSLVFTNTPSTGARMPVGNSTPIQPYLELSLRVGETRTDIVRRALASALLDKHKEATGMTIRFRRVTLTTKPRVTVIADNKRVGRTPVVIRAEPGALRVILPR